MKKMFLKSSQNSQEHTCVEISFFIKLRAVFFLIKKGTPAQAFPCEFSKILKNNFFTEHLRTTASVLEKTNNLPEFLYDK